MTSYDTFLYPSAVYPQTHPDRLATIGRLFDLNAAAVPTARVLELGCGDGSNLIAMACTLPGARFVGVDLAAGPVAKGQQIVATLKLADVNLRQMDLLQVPADLGEFDFIIAHGLYSWVPEPVREKILAVCREHLAENGVAYISYNAYPGNHLRDLARRMMRFHVQQFAEPAEQIRQARTLLKFLSTAKTKPGHWQDVLKHQCERIERYLDAGFFHDDLSEVNQAFYFHEIIERASRHQLQFLGEADFTDMQPSGLTEEAWSVVRNLETCNLVAREQYFDFIDGRAFRQTLLCHQHRRLNHSLVPERAFDFFFASDCRPARPDADLTGPTVEDFQRAKGVLASGHPVLKSALTVLGQCWPRRLPFQELSTQAMARAGRAAAAASEVLASDRRDLGEFLLRCYAVGFVDLHVWPSCFVTEISERPTASPLARLQLRSGPMACSLRHQTLRIDDSLGRQLVLHLDGTRDRAALIDSLAALVKSGAAEMVVQGTAVTEPERVRSILREGLEQKLRALAILGLLIA